MTKHEGEAAEAAAKLLKLNAEIIEDDGGYCEQSRLTELVCKAYLSTVSPPAEGEVQKLIDLLHEYAPCQIDPVNDLLNEAAALLTRLSASAERKEVVAERSDISFERAMEMGAMVLKLHERGLELANIKEKADEWTRNAQDYRSVCYASAPILAVKLRDALSDLQKALSNPQGEAT